MSDIGAEQAALSITRVSLIYRHGLRHRRALADVSLAVDPGTTFGLIGPNGAGKSTLLHCVVGLLRPDAGTIRLAGLAPSDPRSRRHLGFLPHRVGFTACQTARSYLRLHARLLGIRERRPVRQAADRFDVGSYWGRPLRQLSRGMLQRVGLAAATLGRPSILVLDEPTSGLDPTGIRLLRDAIHSHQRRGGATMISSHDLGELSRLCDRIALLDSGRLRRQIDLRRLPQRPHFRVELGDPPDSGELARLAIPGASAVHVDKHIVTFRLKDRTAANAVIRGLVTAGFSVRSAHLDEFDLEREFHETLVDE